MLLCSPMATLQFLLEQFQTRSARISSVSDEAPSASTLSLLMHHLAAWCCLISPPVQRPFFLLTIFRFCTACPCTQKDPTVPPCILQFKTLPQQQPLLRCWQRSPASMPLNTQHTLWLLLLKKFPFTHVPLALLALSAALLALL